MGILLEVRGVTKRFGGLTALSGVQLQLEEGTIGSVIGPNGAGKTTLFRMIAGEESPDEGQAAVDQGVTIGYFSQDVGEMSGRSAVSEAMDGAGPVSLKPPQNSRLA